MPNKRTEMHLVYYLAFVHVQSLCAKCQLSLRSADGALQEALLFLKLSHNLQLGIDLPNGHNAREIMIIKEDKKNPKNFYSFMNKLFYLKAEMVVFCC